MSTTTVAQALTIPEPAANYLLDITTDVFASMVGHELTCVAPNDMCPPGAAEIVGTVAFAGSWTGYVAVVTSHSAARRITSSLLGADGDEAEAQTRDAMGEVANMIAGGLRTRMAKPGDAWTTTVPLVASGRAVTLEHPRGAGLVVHRFWFGPPVLEVHLVVTSMAQ